MTVKRRLFLSNILMILVPVISTVLIGLACIGFIWIAMINGVGLGIQDREDFEIACAAVAESVEGSLKKDGNLSVVETLLESNGMSIRICSGNDIFYSYGNEDMQDQALFQAADLLGNGAMVTQGGRSLCVYQESIDGTDYTIYLTGSYQNPHSYSDLKTAVAFSIVIIIFTIFLSILLTNRFLTKFVLKRIEVSLDILASGVHELRDGNLDYQITYDRHDEFQPVCEDFNEMAIKLKESVHQIQQQERSRKELIAGISHDIRSPLTSIQAYVEGLLDGIAKTPEAKKRYLETIKVKAEDLEHIVSQLFLFSKMELGEYAEELCDLRLDKTIADTVNALQEEYQQKGLFIQMNLEPVTIHADPVQIQRITTNILENSLKYKIKAQGNIRIVLKKSEESVLLTFSDDGPGVPEESLPHLFEVFYRSDPARQNPNKGSGLGLAIVANAVQRMGGTVTAVHSTLGGLEIRIIFPEEVKKRGKNIDY